MKDLNIVFAGFGGQGILFAGKVVAYAGLIEGRELSWLPSYGPEMRGGTANCSICLSDVPASKLAEENGLKGLANIILVGKLRKELAFCTEETLDRALQKCIPARKADMLGFNRKALEIGKAQ